MVGIRDGGVGRGWVGMRAGEGRGEFWNGASRHTGEVSRTGCPAGGSVLRRSLTSLPRWDPETQGFRSGQLVLGGLFCCVGDEGEGRGGGIHSIRSRSLETIKTLAPDDGTRRVFRQTKQADIACNKASSKRREALGEQHEG